jgi:basic membrane lipoprotein Med (substrate-binding protein (PBP1-ABC) superfamily)
MGMLAGLMTKSNTIGVVAAFPYPNENAPVNAYHEGAKSVNPNLKFVISYLDSWFDPPKAKEFALAQIAAGADFEYAVSFGLLEACKAKNVYAFGHCIDQNYLAPEVVVSSAMAYWDPAVKFLINEWYNHVTTGDPYNAPMKEVVFFMKDGGADIAPYHQLADKIPAQVKEAVEKKRQDIKDGSFTVPYLPQKAVSTQ